MAEQSDTMEAALLLLNVYNQTIQKIDLSSLESSTQTRSVDSAATRVGYPQQSAKVINVKSPNDFNKIIPAVSSQLGSPNSNANRKRKFTTSGPSTPPLDQKLTKVASSPVKTSIIESTEYSTSSKVVGLSEYTPPEPKKPKRSSDSPSTTSHSNLQLVKRLSKSKPNYSEMLPIQPTVKFPPIDNTLCRISHFAKFLSYYCQLKNCGDIPSLYKSFLIPNGVADENFGIVSRYWAKTDANSVRNQVFGPFGLSGYNLFYGWRDAQHASSVFHTSVPDLLLTIGNPEIVDYESYPKDQEQGITALTSGSTAESDEIIAMSFFSCTGTVMANIPVDSDIIDKISSANRDGKSDFELMRQVLHEANMYSSVKTSDKTILAHSLQYNHSGK